MTLPWEPAKFKSVHCAGEGKWSAYLAMREYGNYSEDELPKGVREGKYNKKISG